MATLFPQGPIVTGSDVMLATITSGATYVYKSDGFQLVTSPGSPLIFRINIIENYITLTTGSQSLLIDNLGKVTIGVGTPGKIYMNNSQFTPISQTTLLSSVLYEPSSIWVGTTTLMPLEFTVGTVLEYVKMAILPTSYYTKLNGTCTKNTSLTDILSLFACNNGLGSCSTNKAWTTIELCRSGVTFEYCSAGTRCSGNCYSGCDGAQICSRNSTSYFCKTAEKVVGKTDAVEDDPSTGYSWLMIIAVIALVLIIIAALIWFISDDSSASTYYSQTSQNSIYR